MRLALVRKVLILFTFTLALAGGTATHAQIVITPPNPAEAIKQGDLVKAAHQARRLAETGDPDGQFMLALFFWHGVSLPQSYQDALNWITLSAVSGHPRRPPPELQCSRRQNRPYHKGAWSGRALT